MIKKGKGLHKGDRTNTSKLGAQRRATASKKPTQATHTNKVEQGSRSTIQPISE